MCNNSQTQSVSQPQMFAHPVAQTPLQSQTDYYKPTILNYSPAVQSIEGDDEIGLGNRINMPNTQSDKGSLWMPHRLVLPNRMVTNRNALSREDDQKNLFDINTGVRFFLFTRFKQSKPYYRKSIYNFSFNTDITKITERIQ